MQYGPEIARLINANPTLLKRLRAALLFINNGAQLKPTLQQEIPQTTDTEADMFFLTGCIYRGQKTNDCVEIAKHNFYQAALLGHAKSLMEFEKLVDTNDIENGLKIIAILTDPNNSLYDITNALIWFEKLIKDKESNAILSIIQQAIYMENIK